MILRYLGKLLQDFYGREQDFARTLPNTIWKSFEEFCFSFFSVEPYIYPQAVLAFFSILGSSFWLHVSTRTRNIMPISRSCFWEIFRTGACDFLLWRNVKPNSCSSNWSLPKLRFETWSSCVVNVVQLQKKFLKSIFSVITISVLLFRSMTHSFLFNLSVHFADSYLFGGKPASW
jgi:hypothetical protein